MFLSVKLIKIVINEIRQIFKQVFTYFKSHDKPLEIMFLSRKYSAGTVCVLLSRDLE
jgi:hypothetical protein